MRLFNVIETVLNCLYMALEIWDWLEKHFGGVSGNPRKFRHSALWNFLGGWSAA
ncbi:hypothetical protein RZ674_005086 [Klebsiella pneumoniae]|nr:hypothetical protein [Klebsiella pneumoniae]